MSKKADPLDALLDLSGKVGIVTGGNAGIGLATVQHLARKGAKVYMAARNEEKATAALERLNKEGLDPGNGQVLWLKLDLSDPREAQKSADDFLQKEKRLDFLVNNAAMLMTYFSMGPLGIAESMIVNHFSPVVFTRTLLPLMRETARQPGSDVRIIMVSSDAHSLVPVNFQFATKDDFNKKLEGGIMGGRMTRYGVSKLANVLYAKELQRHLDQDGTAIICMSLHPGAVHSDGSEVYFDTLPLPGLMRFIGRRVLQTPAQGSLNSVFAVASPAVAKDPAKYKGAYLLPVGKITPGSKAARNTQMATQLWETTEKLLEEMGCHA